MSASAPASSPTGARSKTSLFLWYWLPVILYVVLIFCASSIPGRDVPVFFPYMDKLEHLTEYALFGLLLGRAFRFTVGGQRGRLWALATVFMGATVGALDELYQRRTPGRDSDVRDWVTDLAAVLIAVLITQYVRVHPIGRHPAEPGPPDPGTAPKSAEEGGR